MRYLFENDLNTRIIGEYMELTDGEITTDYKDLSDLAPVIEKIQENGKCIHVIGNSATFHDKDGLELFNFTDGESLTDAVYKAVLEFLKFHN